MIFQRSDKGFLRGGTADFSALSFCWQSIADIAKLKELTGSTNATIGKMLNYLLDFNIIEEITGNKRNRLFCYNQYIKTMHS